MAAETDRTPSPSLDRGTPERLARLLALPVVVVGSLGLAGWHGGLPELTHWAGALPMTYLSALHVLLAGLGLAALTFGQTTTARTFALALAGIFLAQVVAFTADIHEPSWPLHLTAAGSHPIHTGWTAALQLSLYLVLPALALLALASPRWRHAPLVTMFFGASYLGVALGDALGFLPAQHLLLFADSAQPTVFSALLLALGLLSLAYSRLSARNRRLALAPAQAYTAILALSLVIAHGLEHFLADQSGALQTAEAQWLGRNVDETQRGQISAIERMAMRWENNLDFSKTVWIRDVHSYVEDMEGLEALHWVDNQLFERSGVAYYLSRQTPDYNRDPLLRQLFMQAQAHRQPMYSPHVPATDGVQGFYYIRALHRNDEPDGFLVALFAPQTLLEALLPPGQLKLQGVALQYDGRPIQTAAHTPNTPADGAALYQPLAIGDGHWGLGFVHSAAPLATLFPVLVLASGALAALLVGGVLLQLRFNAERAETLEDLNRQQLENETRLKEAQHIAHLGHWELDLARNQLSWSDEIFELFEIDPRQFSPSYEAFLNGIHPDDREAVNQAYRQSLVDQAPYEIVHRLLMPDGRIKWVEERCSTDFDPHGTPLRSKGTVQDITARHLVEERLKESEKNLLAMLETSPVAARVACKNGQVIFFNHRYAELINLQDGDAKNIDPRSFYARPGDYEDVLETLSRGDPIYDRLIKLKIAGAGTKWTLASYIPMQFQGEEAVLGWFYDITELKHAQTQVTEQGMLTQTVLDHMVDGVITIDLTGIVQSFSPSAQAIFGYNPDEVIGHNVSMLMPSPYREQHDGYLRRYQTTREKRIIGIGREVEGRRKNGTTFPMELAVSEIRHREQVIYIGIVRDITERKRIDKMKNEFVSTVSHELRTPLTAIRGALGLLNGSALKEQLPDNARHLLSIAGNNTERLLLLINDILDIQKIESGQMMFHFSQFELIPFLQKTLIDLQAYADQHQVKFVLTSEASDGRVYADRDRLGQVMANLLSNAAKFSPKDSAIDVGVAYFDRHVRVSVSDHGPGIPEAFQHRLFERFAQADSSDVRAKGGTGLGLAITKAIVEKHGGQIGFHSVPGQGTTFFFDLPRQMVTLNVPAPAAATGAAMALIVEDDPDIAALVQRMLKDAGFESDVAHTADEARHLLKQNPGHYQFLTLDLILPGEDGISLLRSLRQEPATHELPVVVVSVKASEAKLEMNGGAVGVVDWLTKPIDQTKLIEAVQQAARHRTPVRVLHVEDDPDIQHVVAGMLQDQCEITFADTLEDARQKLKTEDFGLVLLDIGLPDGSGLDLLDLVEERVHPPLVVVFSAQDVPREYAHRVNASLQKARTSNARLLQVVKEVVHRV